MSQTCSNALPLSLVVGSLPTGCGGRAVPVPAVGSPSIGVGDRAAVRRKELLRLEMSPRTLAIFSRFSAFAFSTRGDVEESPTGGGGLKAEARRRGLVGRSFGPCGSGGWTSGEI